MSVELVGDGVTLEFLEGYFKLDSYIGTIAIALNALCVEVATLG